MSRATTAIRTLSLHLAGLAGRTVRISNVLPGLAGAAMVSWGASMIYTPAGWITGGIMLLTAALEVNSRQGRLRQDRQES